MKTYDVIDHEYNNRKKISEVTNLVAEEPEKSFVSLSLFNMVRSILVRIDLVNDPLQFEDGTADDMDIVRDDVKRCLNYVAKHYDDERLDLHFIPEPEKEKREVDICPYCGNKMFITSRNKPINRLQLISADIYFECSACGARSPRILYSSSLLDREKVKQEMALIIEDTIVNHDEDEEDCDEYEGN